MSRPDQSKLVDQDQAHDQDQIYDQDQDHDQDQIYDRNKQLKLLYPVKYNMAKMCQREQTHMFLLSNHVFKKSKGMKYQKLSDKYKYNCEVRDNQETYTNTAFPICRKSIYVFNL